MDYKLIEDMLNANLVDYNSPQYTILDKLEIPKEFERVVMKMLPEIKGIELFDCLVQRMYNPSDWDVHMGFKPSFNIFIKESEKQQGDCEYYQEKLKSFFLMTYGNEMSSFIKIGVNKVIETRKKTNEELFWELFGKKVGQIEEPRQW